MLYVTKRVSFSAAHRLHNPELSAEENCAIYDKCNNYNGHGHNYIMDVTVAGVPDPRSGYVIDLKLLKRIIVDEIVSKVDHKHLNYDVEFLSGTIPTVENLAVAFWDILASKIPSGRLYHIRLYETETSWLDYYGDK